MRIRLNSSCYRLLFIGLYICFYPYNSIHAQADFPKIDTTQLLAYYNFEGSFEEVYGKFPDAIPYLVDLGAGQFCNGESATRFTSLSSLLKLPKLPSISDSEGFTVSFMIYLDEFPQQETRIISCSDSANHDNGSFWISVYPEGQSSLESAWSFTYVDKSGEPHSTKADWGMIKGNWIPYTITYNGSVLMLYLGAEPVLEAEVTDMDMNESAFPVWIGNSVFPGFKGKLDYIYLFKRAFSPEELLFNSEQYIFWPDESVEHFTLQLGDTIELSANARAPFLKYTFLKDGKVLQEGSDSILVINGMEIDDFGTYTCEMTNCNATQVKTFNVELTCNPSTFELVALSEDRSVYRNSEVSLGLEVLGSSEITIYDWFLNGQSIEWHNNPLDIGAVNESDTGFYYCRIQDQCDTFYSDSIYLGLLPRNSYPITDTSGLQAYYGFNGNFEDSTKNTTSILPVNAQLEPGLFSLPQTAISFTDPGSFLEIMDTSFLDLSEQFSIILLIKIDSLPDEPTKILSKQEAASDSIGNYSLFVNTEGYLEFGVTSADETIYTSVSANPLQPGRWHFILVYLDNQELGIVVDKKAGAPTILNNPGLLFNEGNLKIGNLNSEGVHISLDEFRIYRTGMKAEFNDFRDLFRPKASVKHRISQVCPPTEVLFDALAYGPCLHYRFFKDNDTIQEGEDSNCLLQIESDDDAGTYYCQVSNALDTITISLETKPGRRYDGLFLYDSNDDIEFYSENDDVHLSFYVSSNLEGLEYEMYHNGVLIPDVFRGILTIENAGPEAMGEYYFVVINGCERMVSDTVTLIMEGVGYRTYEVAGWDWTSNISGNGNSYFSSICRSDVDSSYILLGYFSGGLKIEDRAYFSSQADDIFIVKLDRSGNYKWSQVITSPYFKGKGDLVADPRGNIYVSGSFRNSIQIDSHALSTAQGTGCAYLAKYSPDGKLLWLKVMESSGAVSCSNIEYGASGHIMVGGNFEGALTVGEEVISGTWNPYANLMYVAAFDHEGNKEWLNYAVTDQNMLLGFGLVDMDLSLSGELVVSGTYSGSVDFGSGVELGNSMEGAFLVKFDAYGQAVWAKSMKSESGFAETFDVSVDHLDRIYLTGMYVNNMSFDTLTIGYQDELMEEIFLARFDADGNCTLLRSYGSTGNGGDYGVCFEPVSDSIAYLMGLYGDELIMGEDTLVADPNSGGAGVSPNMFFCQMTPDGDPLQLMPAGIRSRSFSGEIMATGEGQVIFAGLNEVSLVKKSSNVANITLAFAGMKTIVADTTGNPGTDPGTAVVASDEVLSLFRVYPNPASGTVYIQSTGTSQFDLEIYSLEGVRISTHRQKTTYEVNVSFLTPGVYILKMSMEGKQAYGRILVR